MKNWIQKPNQKMNLIFEKYICISLILIWSESISDYAIKIHFEYFPDFKLRIFFSAGNLIQKAHSICFPTLVDINISSKQKLTLWFILIGLYFSFQDYCKRDKAKLWIHYKPSLFQHIGTHSSLKGKVQKLKVSFSR